MVASSIGSWRYAIDLLDRTCGREDRKLEPLRAHVLDQKRPICNSPTTGNLKGVATRGIGNLDRNVGIRLFIRRSADHARPGTFLPSRPANRAVVDTEGPGDGGADRSPGPVMLRKLSSASVSQLCLGPIPAMDTMSPASCQLDGSLLKPRGRA